MNEDKSVYVGEILEDVMRVKQGTGVMVRPSKQCDRL